MDQEELGTILKKFFISEVAGEGEKEESPGTVEVELPRDIIPAQIIVMMKDMFGMKHSTYEQEKKLLAVYDLVHNKMDIKNPSGIRMTIRGMMTQAGNDVFGVGPLNNLWNWLSLMTKAGAAARG